MKAEERMCTPTIAYRTTICSFFPIKFQHLLIYYVLNFVAIIGAVINFMLR